MRLLYSLVVLLLLNNCSFDNKSGIWKNENIVANKNDSPLKDFKKISNREKIFEKTVVLDNKFLFKLTKPVKNLSWSEFFYNNSNNFQNIKYNNNNQLIFQSKKLTKHSVGKLLFEKNNLIINDKKGNIIVYSLDKNDIQSRGKKTMR